MRFLKALQVLVLNTLFPPVCSFCKKEGNFLCIDCFRSLKIKKIRGKKRDKDPDFHFLDGVIYALDYAENKPIQSAIKQLKYKYTLELAQTFGELMSQKLNELNMIKGKEVILIPVPLHKKRLNERGFNQAEVIANHIPEVKVLHLLERTRNTKQQAKLSKSERHQNLEGAFRIRPDTMCHTGLQSGMNKKCIQKFFMHAGPQSSLCGERRKGEKACPVRRCGEKQVKEKGEKKNSIFFIVDDVCTTGSTLEKCAEVLKNEGIEKVYGLVIARAFK